MLIGRVEGATRNLGAPLNWNAKESGLCSTLPILDTLVGDVPWMISAWQPTPEEIEDIKRGASIHLWIQGTVHPVVGMAVGPPP